MCKKKNRNGELREACEVELEYIRFEIDVARDMHITSPTLCTTGIRVPKCLEALETSYTSLLLSFVLSKDTYTNTNVILFHRDIYTHTTILTSSQVL